MAVLVPWQSRQLPLAVPAVDSLHTNSILTSASVTSFRKNIFTYITLLLITLPSANQVLEFGQVMVH